MAWAACGKASPAATAAALRVRCSSRPCPRSCWRCTGRDVPPGQVLDLGVQAWLVLLHDQDVMRLLLRDQELGVIALGMQRVGGDDAPGQVQGLQQRREPGDLVGLAVHAGLGEHGTGAADRGRPAGARPARRCWHDGCPAPPCRPRPPPAGARRPCSCSLVSGPQPRIQPGPHRGIERVGVYRFQDPADGGLIRRLEPAGQRITADPESGQDLRRRVRDPFADRGERPRPGQHRRHGGQ